MIEQLHLSGFRNYGAATLDFSSGTVVLLGRNGTGKSNLLEALSYLSILRSFRGATPREMTAVGAREFTLAATVARPKFREKLLVRENLAGKRSLFIGESAIRRASEFIGEFRTIPFAPEDRGIVSGSSGLRRRFFDMLISTIDRNYLGALSSYYRALMQRNKALKCGNQTSVRAFEPELAVQAPMISKCRREYAQKVCAEVQRLFGERAQFELRYNCSYPQEASEYLRNFETLRERETLRGCTLCGPQLDEFEFLYNGKLLRGFGSSGQVRITALLLRLAQFNLLKALGSTPVLVLADDVCGELDENNRELFFRTIASADQRFFTFTDPPQGEIFQGAQIIRTPL